MNRHEHTVLEQHGTSPVLQQTQHNMTIQRSGQVNVRFNSLNSSMNMDRSTHSISGSSITTAPQGPSLNKTIHIEPTYGPQRNMIQQHPQAQGRSFVTFTSGPQAQQNFYMR